MQPQLDIRPIDSDADHGLSERDRYEVLASEQRRITLDVLTARSHAIHLDELATQVAAREGPTDEGAVERVRITLHHQHLPKLADLGLVAYDRETHSIEPNADRLDALSSAAPV